VSWQGYAQIVVVLAAVVLSAKPLGAYMARVFEGAPTLLDKPLGWLERLVYRLAGVPTDVEGREMTWTTYALAMLLFNVVGIVVVYAILRLQGHLPLNPEGMAATTPDLSWNTAVSFVTNTNWQSYGGETTLSYFTQMIALGVQNFVCAASGMAVMVALLRGISRKTTPTLGNFWVDLTRGTLYVLLPLSIVLARRSRPTPTRQPGRSSRSAPSPPRRRSNSSAPTEAASSTSTPPTHSKTRPLSRTRSRSTRCSSSPSRSRTPSA
jgi:K+-transporting ATPase ATPase A chain